MRKQREEENNGRLNFSHHLKLRKLTAMCVWKHHLLDLFPVPTLTAS